MVSFTQLAFWMFVLVGFTNGNHAGRTRTARIGRVGNPILSIDPFAVQAGRMSGLSSPSVSSHSGSSPTSGSARRFTASASIGVQPGSLARRVVSTARRRGLPVITRIQGRPMLVVRTGSQGSPLIRRTHPRPQRIISQRHQLAQHGVFDILGLAPTSLGSQVNVGLSHSPPGVSFLGGQRLAGNAGQYVPLRNIPVVTNPVVSNKIPVTLTGLNSIVAGNTLSGQSLVQLPVAQPANPNAIPGSSTLEVGGLTPKGELIIRGPGGSITIGRELLTGISQNNPMPFFTEFEEIEAEGAAAGGAQTNRNPNTLKLTEPGRGSIVIDQSGAKAATSASATSKASSGSAGLIEVLNPGTSAKTSATSSASSSSASASSSSSAGTASSSASASSGGSGITVESGGKSGRVIRLGDTPGKTQVITMGGAKDQIQFAKGGSGINVPGNATFIVGG